MGVVCSGRDRLAGRRQRVDIDEQVAVAGLGPAHARGRHAHAFEAEADPRAARPDYTAAMATPVRPMNYRHAYHAGNFADVFKHAVLVELLASFLAKPAPMCYFDTHAGRGLYDLESDQATRTNEAAQGVLQLARATRLPPPLRTYLDLVRSINADVAAEGIRHYPGSPLIAGNLLRAQDRAILCELQDGEARSLATLFRDRASFHVHHRDGYEALRALLPPREKRGLVLIDPPFEAQEAEFGQIEVALDEALKRWPTGRYAVWYPIKLRRHIEPFHRWLRQRLPGKVLVAEFLLHPDNTGLRLNGCGLALVNPPWRIEIAIEAILEALRQHLAQATPATGRVHWLDARRDDEG